MVNRGEMLCPIDGVPLVMSERQSIEIDYCPQCRGVWLDRGELDKIIERNAMAAGRLDRDDDYDDDRPRVRDREDSPRDRDAYPDYPSGGDHGGYRPQKKRRGLHGEIFDFD